jgi:hypothetical protein
VKKKCYGEVNRNLYYWGGGESVFGVLMARELSLLDKCLVVLLVVAVAGIVLLLANGLMAKSPTEPKVKPLEEEAKPAELACPPPTVARDGKCVLESDATLDKTLRVPSGTKLDCQNFQLTPSVKGKEQTGTNPSVPSVPVAAVFLNDVTGAHVENCVINDFDFGIVAVNDGKAEKVAPSKRAVQRIIISGNTINTLYNTIDIIKADNIEIRNNHLTSQGYAAAIQSLLDSDFLHIHNNQITTTKPSLRIYNIPNPPAAPYFPGSPDFLNFADGIAFGQTPATFDFKLDNTLITFVDTPSQKATNNIVEQNNIDVTQGATGVYVSVYQDGLIIRDNTITGGSDGVGVVAFLYPFNSFPDPSTWSTNVLVENNIILGSQAAGVASRNAFNTLIRGNSISSAEPSTTQGTNLFGFNTGITLSEKSLENAIVTRNVINGKQTYGLELTHGDSLGGIFGPNANFFGAKIFLNDIMGSTKAGIINAAPGYSFPTELSVNGKGNHWGRTCDDDDGFREFDDKNPDSPSPLVNDSHPYGVPVAGTPDASLPTMPPGKCS